MRGILLMQKTIVVACFPGVGKTTFAEKHKRLKVVDIKCTDKSQYIECL